MSMLDSFYFHFGGGVGGETVYFHVVLVSASSRILGLSTQ